MLTLQDFEAMRKEMQAYDCERELLIKQTRDVIKLSKTIIYAVHRNEFKIAQQGITDSKKIIIDLKKKIAKEPELYFEGSYRAAIQEYVKAFLYYTFAKEKRIATRKETDVDTEHYLLGICDLTGELARRAIVSATNDRYEDVMPIRNVVEQLFEELMSFDFRGGDLRKKLDQIKYDMRRLDDVAFQLKMKDKI